MGWVGLGILQILRQVKREHICHTHHWCWPTFHHWHPVWWSVQLFDHLSEICLAYVYSQINPHNCVPDLVPIGPAVWQLSRIFFNFWPPKTQNSPSVRIFILPINISRWICMCVPNLVPIGPYATTCIRLERYTHRHTHTHTHTLLYMDDK